MQRVKSNLVNFSLLNTKANFESEAKQLIDSTSLVPSTLALQSLDWIRVSIEEGRGMGHQRAPLTAMRRLRELGYTGDFDVVYTEANVNFTEANSIGRRLQKLIPGYQPKAVDEKDEGWKQDHVDLGKIQVRRLAKDEPPLFPVKLAITAGGGSTSEWASGICEFLNADAYIQLQPTDWEGYGNCIRFRNQYDAVILPSTLRLSAQKLVSTLQQSTLSSSEQGILKLCEDKKILTQLVYGLYESPAARISECKSLLQAHKERQAKNPQPVVLFFPQKIWPDLAFQNALNATFENIEWVDLTQPESGARTYKNNSIIFAYTGSLSQPVFDALLLHKTFFPPVIEGCNAREACEFSGRPFIHGGSNESLKQYSIEAKFADYQRIHTQASLCLEEGGAENNSALVNYLENAQSQPEFLQYHRLRRSAFLARPDACETALFEWAQCLPEGQLIAKTGRKLKV